PQSAGRPVLSVARDRPGALLPACRPRADHRRPARTHRSVRSMITTTVLVFIFFSLTGMPIAFALGMAGMAGILVGGFPMVQLSPRLTAVPTALRSSLRRQTSGRSFHQAPE